MDTVKRIEATRKALHLNHGEMAKELGISRAMYYCIKKGEKPLGNKAFRELERLEGGPLRTVESDARIKDAALFSNQYGTETEKQLAFEREMAKKHIKIESDRADAAEKKLKLFKRKLAGLLKELEDNI